MILDGNIFQNFWAETAETAKYLLNRIPCRKKKLRVYWLKAVFVCVFYTKKEKKNGFQTFKMYDVNWLIVIYLVLYNTVMVSLKFF